MVLEIYISCYLIAYGSGKCVGLQQFCCFFVIVCSENILILSYVPKICWLQKYLPQLIYLFFSVFMLGLV